jgi:hypothetical protein
MRVRLCRASASIVSLGLPVLTARIATVFDKLPSVCASTPGRPRLPAAGRHAMLMHRKNTGQGAAVFPRDLSRISKR